MKDYCEKHPEVSSSEAFDIIRPKADQDYLNATKLYCSSNDNENSGQ